MDQSFAVKVCVSSQSLGDNGLESVLLTGDAGQDLKRDASDLTRLHRNVFTMVHETLDRSSVPVGYRDGTIGTGRIHNEVCK